jgi:hypothetical protein
MEREFRKYCAQKVITYTFSGLGYAFQTKENALVTLVNYQVSASGFLLYRAS